MYLGAHRPAFPGFRVKIRRETRSTDKIHRRIGEFSWTGRWWAPTMAACRKVLFLFMVLPWITSPDPSLSLCPRSATLCQGAKASGGTMLWKDILCARLTLRGGKSSRGIRESKPIKKRSFAYSDDSSEPGAGGSKEADKSGKSSDETAAEEPDWFQDLRKRSGHCM
jgi:hypothetical protein